MASDKRPAPSSSETKDEALSDEAIQRRFEAITRAVLTTPPLKMKDIPRKRPYRARKAKQTLAASGAAEKATGNP